MDWLITLFFQSSLSLWKYSFILKIFPKFLSRIYHFLYSYLQEDTTLKSHYRQVFEDWREEKRRENQIRYFILFPMILQASANDQNEYTHFLVECIVGYIYILGFLYAKQTIIVYAKYVIPSSLISYFQ